MSLISPEGKQLKGYYHTWDNMLMPSFVTEKDSRFAETLFHNPSTACYENNLNSVIAKPAQSGTIALTDTEPYRGIRIQWRWSGGPESQSLPRRR